ncbi:hypothetical protein EMIT0P12_50485 [Pseudomonas sp. IT-P12]
MLLHLHVDLPEQSSTTIKALAVLIVDTPLAPVKFGRHVSRRSRGSDMSTLQAGVLCRYQYDPLDRLIGTATQQSATLQRFYCIDRLATEIEGSLQTTIMQHGDQVLAQQRRAADTRATDLLATDLQRTVMYAVSHTARSAMCYSPYGHRFSETCSATLLGFNGERLDEISRCYLLGNGHRAYSPVLERFNSPDGLSPFGKGGLNVYAYCSGDPVNRGDQSGRFSAPWIAHATSSFIKSRANSLKGVPWYSWGTNDIDVVKHVTRSSSPFTVSDYQATRVFQPNTATKRYSAAHIQPSEYPSPRGGRPNGGSLLENAADSMGGNALIGLRKGDNHLGAKVDRSYYRNDLMRANQAATGKFPPPEVSRIPYWGDLERSKNLLRAVHLELQLRLAQTDVRRGLIAIDLKYRNDMNRLLGHRQ